MRRDTNHALVASILRGGVGVGGVLLAVGLVIGIAAGDTSAPTLRLVDLFAPGPLHARFELAGILVCGATPGVAVLALIGSLAPQRDWRAVATATAVLAILVVGMILGHV
jgi:uncharacterized membrane protein